MSSSLTSVRVIGDGAEGELLACINGHNLCADVFGAQSEGETAAGLCFHGEAGLVQWEVTAFDDSSVTLAAHLRQTALDITRTYTLQGPVCHVSESITNLVGFERALGEHNRLLALSLSLTELRSHIDALCQAARSTSRSARSSSPPRRDRSSAASASAATATAG